MCLAVPGQVLEVMEGPLRMGRIAFGGLVKEASLALVPQASVGSYVLIHAGMALEVLDEDQAKEILQAFADLEKTGQDPKPA